MAMDQKSAFLKPVLPGQQFKSKGIPWSDPEFENNFPNLTAYLTQSEYEGGNKRQLSTLTLFFDSGCLTLVLNDRENGRSSFVSEASLFSCLLKVETSLSDGSTDWRAARGATQPKKDIPW